MELCSINEDNPPIELKALLKSPRSSDPIPPMEDDPADELVRGDSTWPRGGDVTFGGDVTPLGGDVTPLGGDVTL